MFFDFTNPWMMLFLVALIVENISVYITEPAKLLTLLLSIPGILIAITFHEFAHAFVADKLGDDTPRRQGRLSLNPLAHLDIYGTFLMIVAGFGWGKPVQINPNNFRRTITIKKGEALVSIAGPAMNLILAIVFSIIYGLIIKFGGLTFILSSTGSIISEIIQYIIAMNVGLCVFNLLPLPPLDGSKILLAFLPTKAQTWFEEHEKMLYIIFIVIWLTPISSLLIEPGINAINSALLKLIQTIVL